MKRIGLCVGVQYYTKLYRSIFNILKQHKDTFLFGRRLFFIQEWSDFFPIIGDKSPKSDMELTDLFWLQTSVWAILSALARYREPKEISALVNCFRGYGYSWNWLSHCDDDASITHNNENRISLRASPPFKGYREKSIASGTRKETQEPRCRERKWELFVSSASPPGIRRTLSRSLPTRGCSHQEIL